MFGHKCHVYNYYWPYMNSLERTVINFWFHLYHTSLCRKGPSTFGSMLRESNPVSCMASECHNHNAIIKLRTILSNSNPLFLRSKKCDKRSLFHFSKKGLAKKRAERRPELIYFCQRAISHSRHVCICLLFQLGKRGEWKFCWFKIKDRKGSKRLKLKEKKESARFWFKVDSFLC